ncbi:hypothetical protein SZ63_09185 [Methanoculleus sediminis]|uniref:Uncharacterized protein n=1 Tax=Methanoculleus sediminis TaxID=1550566 RepID=A0A0H1QYT4_9EURY|nr:hypothetical protein [Methanoculleus sediminis]KLK87781.1 hypothetical protein SZ63_09185 [Methanoculleus sediminis]
MTGNLWVLRALLVVLFVAAAGVVFPAAAQSTAGMEPLTWTLAPTPGETPEETLTEETAVETPDDETPEATLDETIEDELPEDTLDGAMENETPEETLAGTVENETPEETLAGTVENETLEETLAGPSGNTTNESAPPVVVETDEATPAETSTADLPTFTPIQAAQVNGSATQAAPLSIAGVVLAVAVAGLLVVIGRNRK